MVGCGSGIGRSSSCIWSIFDATMFLGRALARIDAKSSSQQEYDRGLYTLSEHSVVRGTSLGMIFEAAVHTYYQRPLADTGRQ